MSLKRCPICRLFVDERHRYCGCGYDWALTPAEWRAVHRRDHRPRSGLARSDRWLLLIVFLLVLLSCAGVRFCLGPAPS